MARRTEIDAWVQGRQSGDRVQESDRVIRLIRRVEELELENQDLRRQLEVEQRTLLVTAGDRVLSGGKRRYNL